MTMKKTEFTFPSASKEPVDIHAFCYQDERREPVGIVQITHGLSEHMEGFEDLISFLTENGYICVGMDLLGHGKTAGPGCTGITPDDTNKAIWKDMLTLYQRLHAEHPELPYFSYSHSMGSVMMRAFLAMYAGQVDFQGCFFSADSHLPAFGHKLIVPANLLGRLLTNYKKDLAKRRATYTYQDYGQHPPIIKRILFFWLSFDQQHIKDYINDPYSGGATLFNLVTFVVKALSTFVLADQKGWAEKVPADTVYHHGCGRWDIPGFLGKGPGMVHRDLEAAGRKTELHLYQNSMHEPFGERKVRDQFFADLLTFFNENNPLLK